MDLDPQAWNQRFDEAVEYFRSKGFDISPNGWRDLWKGANQRSFTVARVTAMDVLSDIRSLADRAIDAGDTLDDFKRDLIPNLTRKGWWTPDGEDPIDPATGQNRLTPWRLETIFRTNIADAYAVGRYKQQTEMAANRPWWEYLGVDDGATRPDHGAMHGHVARYDDAVWSLWYPPNGFNCRCWVRSLREGDLARRGLKPSGDPPEINGEPAAPDDGWDYNPGEAGLAAWKPKMERFPADWRSLLAAALGSAESEAIRAKLLADVEKHEERIADLARDFDRVYQDSAEEIRKLQKKYGRRLVELPDVDPHGERAMDLHKKIDEIEKRLEAQRDRRKAAQKKLRAAEKKRDDVATNAIKTPGKANFNDAMDLGEAAGLKRQAKKAAAWLDDVASKGLNRPFKVSRDPGGYSGRAYYQPTQKKVAIPDRGKDDIGTYIHEIGHHIEYNDPAVKKRAQAFLEKRTAGEAARPLNEILGRDAYRPDEIAKPDKFFSPYVGKVYSDGATEVISMGVERMYRNPAGFAKEDPEYFNFILDILHGR